MDRQVSIYKERVAKQQCIYCGEPVDLSMLGIVDDLGSIPRVCDWECSNAFMDLPEDDEIFKE